MQRRLMALAPLLAGLIACSPAGPAGDGELADALAEADEATVADFSGAMPRPCALLSRAEVEAAIGPLSGAAVQPPEQATDVAEARCQWQGGEGRVLRLAASGEGGLERFVPTTTDRCVAGTPDTPRRAALPDVLLLNEPESASRRR